MDDPPMALVTQTSIDMPTAAVADPVTTPAQPAPVTALPAQQTNTKKAGNGGAARTSEQDAAVPEPSPGSDGQAREPQTREPTPAQQNTNDDGSAPATAVDNRPSRTATTQDAAGIIASALSKANAQATATRIGSNDGASSGSTGGDESEGSLNATPPSQNEDSRPSVDLVNEPTDHVSQETQPASSGDGQGSLSSSNEDDPENYRSGGQLIGAASNDDNESDEPVAMGSDDGSPAGSVALPTGTAARTPPPLTLGTQVLTAHSVAGSDGAVVIGGKTLQEGGAVATLNGHVVSLGVHGKIKVDGSVPVAVDNGAMSTTIALTDLTEIVASLTLGSERVLAEETRLHNGQIAALIDGQTITSGSKSTSIDGTVISFGNDGLVMQTIEARIPFTASSALITAGPTVLTASKTILPDGQTAAVVGNYTLRLGGPPQTLQGEIFCFCLERAHGAGRGNDRQISVFREGNYDRWTYATRTVYSQIRWQDGSDHRHSDAIRWRFGEDHRWRQNQA